VLSRGSALPLARQVAALLRDAVVDGQLHAGAKLPSTRGLAAELGVSRNTVLEAYGQLLSEGYLEGRLGSGTYVTSSLQEVAPRTAARITLKRGLPTTLSTRGRLIGSAQHAAAGDELRAFNPGFPAVDPNLFGTWWRVAARCQRRATRETLSYGDPAGYAPLRQEIASYLGPARGVRCTAAQVVVTAGAQRGLAMCADLLADSGDVVWLENPGYSGARSAFVAAGCELIPVPVDGEGFDIDFAIERAPGARLVYVSPSHQYPVGVTMSLQRRQRLLEWATRTGAWIIEDDYDSEFRHGNRPLPTLHALDSGARVLYLGTFSKVLFPALRLGYVVVPPDLAEAFARSQAVAGHSSPTVDQAIMADFIQQGHFTRHVRRMRVRYERLRRVLEAAVRTQLGDALQITGADVGLHVFGQLAPGFDDVVVSQAAYAAGITAPPVSAYCFGPSPLSGLVLGYGHLTEQEIQRGVEQLATAIAAPRRRVASASR
jgi:GntR family transcriptional regulator / MocR family aminotransferase